MVRYVDERCEGIDDRRRIERMKLFYSCMQILAVGAPLRRCVGVRFGIRFHLLMFEAK